MSRKNQIQTSKWIAVAESQPVINGWTFNKQLPARAVCLQRDSVNPNWFKFTVAPGDICPAIDGDTPVVERCELSSTNKMSFDVSYVITYQIKIYTPGLKDPASAGWIVIGQIHNTPDIGDISPSPPFAREIGSATRAIYYARRTSTADPLLVNPSPTYFYQDPNPTLAWNTWISVREEHRFSANSILGYHRVYHNGVLKASYDGKTGYVDAVGPYCKFGIYRAKDLTNTLVVEYKDFRAVSVA